MLNQLHPGHKATVVLNAPIPQYYHVTVVEITPARIIIYPEPEDQGIPIAYYRQTGKATSFDFYHLKPYMHQHANQ